MDPQIAVPGSCVIHDTRSRLSPPRDLGCDPSGALPLNGLPESCHRLRRTDDVPARCWDAAAVARWRRPPGALRSQTPHV